MTQKELKTFKEKLSREFFLETFKKSWKGQEKINNLFLWWGGIAYIVYYFILRPIINIRITTGVSVLDGKYGINFFVDYILSLLIISYFTLHIILMFKNRPKEPELTKEEKISLKEKARKERGKRIIRKLLLQESITKFRPWLVFSAINLIIITNYVHIVF